MNNEFIIKNRNAIRRLTLSAMFLAIGIILPFFTGQIQHVGNMLLPMHLPVFLCGMICGWRYGGAVGLILPLLRSLLFGMPPMYPNAVGMAVELEVYGIVAGFIYGKLKRQSPLTVYIALIPAMLIGRAVWGVSQIILLNVRQDAFTWQMFTAGAFFNAIPGIIIQLILIPSVMAVLHYTGVMKFRKESEL